MKKYDYIVGIDPDSKASGFTWIEVYERKVEMFTLPFPELIRKLTQGRGTMPNTLIVVEASWLRQTANGNTHNWHIKKGDNARVASAKGQGIARNQETGRKIVEMCKYHNLEVLEVHPLKKCWKGPDGKITHDELAGILKASGIEVDRRHLKISNPEERDSCWLGLNYSSIPLRVPVQTFKPQH